MRIGEPDGGGKPTEQDRRHDDLAQDGAEGAARLAWLGLGCRLGAVSWPGRVRSVAVRSVDWRSAPERSNAGRRQSREADAWRQGSPSTSAETKPGLGASPGSLRATAGRWAAGGRARRTWQAPPRSAGHTADPRERDTTVSVRLAPSWDVPARMPLEISRCCRATLGHRQVMAQLAPILQHANDLATTYGYAKAVRPSISPAQQRQSVP